MRVASPKRAGHLPRLLPLPEQRGGVRKEDDRKNDHDDEKPLAWVVGDAVDRPPHDKNGDNQGPRSSVCQATDPNHAAHPLRMDHCDGTRPRPRSLGPFVRFLLYPPGTPTVRGGTRSITSSTVGRRGGLRQWSCWSISPGSVVETTRQESHVIFRMTRVMARPISGSARGRPRRDEGGAGDHGQGDEPVDAGVVSVGDQRGAVESPAGSEPDLGGDLVADEADHAGGREHPQVGERLGVQEALDRFVEGDAGGEEDRPRRRPSRRVSRRGSCGAGTRCQAGSR